MYFCYNFILKYFEFYQNNSRILIIIFIAIIVTKISIKTTFTYFIVAETTTVTVKKISFSRLFYIKLILEIDVKVVVTVVVIVVGVLWSIFLSWLFCNMIYIMIIIKLFLLNYILCLNDDKLLNCYFNLKLKH